MRSMTKAALCVVAMLATAPAAAEVLPVLALRPAASRDAAMLVSVTVEPFSGRDGRPVSLAVERALSDRNDRQGRRYFQMMAHVDGLAPESDGLVSGDVQSTVSTTKYKKTEKDCPKDKRDCTDDEKVSVEVECRKRLVTLSADIRIVRLSDRALVYGTTQPQRDEVSWCPDDNSPPDVDAVVRRLGTVIASNVATAVTPSGGRTTTRIREDRKGLDKPLGERFKTAVRLTKTDVAASCREFDAIGEAAPDQAATIFNRGLCRESQGDADSAMSFYSRVNGTDVREAQGRIAATRQALIDEQDRADLLGG